MSRAARWTIRGVIIFALLGVVAYLAIPNFKQSHHNHGDEFVPNELRSLLAAQVRFREKDIDGNMLLDYGSLAQLASWSLVDRELGSGTKWGYTFEVEPGAEREFFWYGIARPVKVDEDHASVFFTNQSGEVWKLPASDPRHPDPKTCDPPMGALLVGGGW